MGNTCSEPCVKDTKKDKETLQKNTNEGENLNEEKNKNDPNFKENEVFIDVDSNGNKHEIKSREIIISEVEEGNDNSDDSYFLQKENIKLPSGNDTSRVFCIEDIDDDIEN